MDPYTAFAGYPSAPLAPETSLVLAHGDLAVALERLEALLGLAMVAYAVPVLASREELEALLRASSRGPAPARDLLAGLPPQRRPLAFRSLLWLLKLGLLRVAEPTALELS
jgi:hypothetical protein